MTVERLVENQLKYCKEHNAPMFLPWDGRCYRCGCNIAQFVDEEVSLVRLITGCPNCNCSFCD